MMTMTIMIETGGSRLTVVWTMKNYVLMMIESRLKQRRKDEWNGIWLCPYYYDDYPVQ